MAFLSLIPKEEAESKIMQTGLIENTFGRANRKCSLGSLMCHLKYTQMKFPFNILPQAELSMRKISSMPIDDDNLSTMSTVFSEADLTDFAQDSPSKDDCLLNYDIICKLSEGSQGAVYLVESKHTKIKYALKVCQKSEQTLKNQNLSLESDIHKNQDHPFIVKYHESFENENYKSILLEFWKGGDLYFHQRKIEQSDRKQFSEKTVKFYICAIALALQYLHGRGILFRDLKPENILIGSNGYPKLWDFGLSQYLTDIEITKNVRVRGSKKYYSPEWVARKRHGMPSDWWTLGILTYELLFGMTPFENANIFQQEQNIRDKSVNFERRSDLSDEWIDFISKLLSKWPEERLGALGINDLKTHPWLADMDWDSIESLDAVPPYKISNEECDDTHFFFQSFTKETIEEEFLARLY